MKIFTRTDSETTKKTFAIYREELKTEKKAFWLACIFVPLQNLLYLVITPLIISFFTQSLITNPHDLQTPILQLCLLVVVAILATLCGHVGFIALFNHEERMTTKLATRGLRGLLAHSHTFFANSKTGALAGDLNTFSRSYLMIADTVALQASSIVVNFVISLIIIAFIAPAMLPVLMLLTTYIIWDGIHAYTKRSVFRNHRKELMSKYFGNLADILGNQTLVRMFGRSEPEVDSIRDERGVIADIARKEVLLLQRNAEWRMIILFSFQIATLALCLFLLTNSLLSIAALIFIITYLGRVTGSLFSIGSIIRTIEQALLDASKVTEILSRTPDILDAPTAKKLAVKNADIEFRDATFGYHDAQDETIFDKLNLHIKATQSVGLVGKSGGGKSTLTHLLLRYMDVDSGEITIDGKNIADVTQDSLREAISYVPQDPYLFHRSLRDNIAYGKPDATDQQIIAAAKKAHAMEFIKTLPNGLDTIVGERGVKLSGGQRQRIAIARAILKDAPILILDEATSALDSESEKLIQDALEKLMKHRTSIVVAHRLSTISKLDRIITLDQGKIIEDGTHEQLLGQKGVYAKLWAHQSGGFIEE